MNIALYFFGIDNEISSMNWYTSILNSFTNKYVKYMKNTGRLDSSTKNDRNIE